MEKSKNQRQLKLIWDFYGPEAEITAKHHAVHLREYTENQQLSVKLAGHELIKDSHWIAFMVVWESEMPAVRDALKPHRGQLYKA